MHIKQTYQQLLPNKCGSKKDVYCILSGKFQEVAFRIEIQQCEMINTASFCVPFRGQRMMSWKFCECAYVRFQSGRKEGESGTIFGKFVLRNEF